MIATILVASFPKSTWKRISFWFQNDVSIDISVWFRTDLSLKPDVQLKRKKVSVSRELTKSSRAKLDMMKLICTPSPFLLLFSRPARILRAPRHS
jgi:hypothetical protein